MPDEQRIPFTSESVTEGHPDKLCDAVADAVLDDVLARDPVARVAVEVAATTGLVLVLGELTTEAWCDVQAVVRSTVRDIGYDDSRLGFDWETCGTITAIKEQSPDIALGVDRALETREGAPEDHEPGAGDQGMMFGYATDESDELMPMPIMLAHRVARRLAEVRKDGTLPFLRPDGKSQVTVEYDADGRPTRVHTVLVSTQHDPDVELADLAAAVRRHVVEAAIPAELLDEKRRANDDEAGDEDDEHRGPIACISEIVVEAADLAARREGEIAVIQLAPVASGTATDET